MNFQLVTAAGIVTAIVWVLVKVIGLPDQIRKNYTRKSTVGLSVPFFLLGFASYGLWTLYELLRRDWVLICGQGAGMITIGVIAWQMYLYRNNKSE